MSFTKIHNEVDNVIEIQVGGKLTSEDYEQFVPVMERLIEKHGKIRVLLEMRDFHGWKAGALWKDIKFDVKHFKDIEKLAMVGEKTWQKAMSEFCKPFTSATVRYFELDKLEPARKWVKSDQVEPEAFDVDAA